MHRFMRTIRLQNWLGLINTPLQRVSHGTNLNSTVSTVSPNKFAIRHAGFQSFSVGVNGNPRSRLNNLRNFRSFELESRLRIPGATSLLVSRRARRPRNQSSQLIGLSSGMHGISDFEFIGYLLH